MQHSGQPHYSGTSLLIDNEACLAHYNRWIVDTILRHVPPLPQAARVLDFGAGIGTLSRIFETVTGIRPEGLELDPAQRQTLEERGFTTHASLDGVAAPFDLIFTSNVLEHIEDDEDALRQLKTRLSPNGTLAIYVPAFRLLWSSMDSKVGPYRRYTRRELENKLNAVGFRVTASHYCDSAGFFLTLLFKCIGSENGEPSGRALRLFDRFILPLSKAADYVFHPFLGKNVFVSATPLTHPDSPLSARC